MVELQRQIENELMCCICPNICVLGELETGECGVRTCRDGKIELDTYGIVSAMAVEPIEKKPITHFLPGTKTLSFGGFGCSLKCKFCENHKISQAKVSKGNFYSPQKIIALAKEHKCPSVCMTYNEPTISYEFLMDVVEEAHSNGLKFILKTNAYVNSGPWAEICSVVDCMNIDWKGNFNSYLEMTGARRDVVFDRIMSACANGVHVEISIPLHDGMKEDHLMKFGEKIYNGCLGNHYNDIPCHLLKIQSAFRHSNTTPEEYVSRVKLALGKYISNISIH